MNAIVVSMAWLLGIYAGSLIQSPLEIDLLGAFLFAGLAAIWWPRNLVRLGALFALVVVLGLARAGAQSESLDDRTMPTGVPITVEGMVASEPEVRDRQTHLVLDVRRVRTADWEPASGKVLIRAARFPGFEYGDVLELTGELEQPKSFEDFDYAAYLAQRGIHWVMDFPSISKVGSGQGIGYLSWIYDLRESLTNSLDRSLPEPQASLAAGVFLGIRTTIPDDLLEAFSRTNTYHILAVSGMNISLVCGLLGALGRRARSRRFNVFLLLAGIAAYGALVGPQPSVIRASIMGALLVIASYLGRPADTIAWLLVAAGLMATYDPGVLRDVGFQLSFVATAGLALLAPLFLPRLSALPRWLGEVLAVTFAAQIATLPITALNFGQLSLVTPLANLFVVPAVLPLLIGAASTATLGLLFDPAGQLVGWVTYLAATYMVLVVEYLGSLPWASLPLGRFGLAPLVPYYLILGLLLTQFGQRVLGFKIPWLDITSRLPARLVIGALGIVAVVVWAGALTVPPGPTTISFLDVGQGDSTLIQTASGRRVLVDGGPSPSTVATTLGRRLPFWDRSIDLVVLTHADEDHLAGLVDVVDRHEVRLVLDPDIPQMSTSYIQWLDTIRRRNIRMVAARAGQEIALDGETRLEIMHPAKPPLDPAKADLNDFSAVSRLAVGNVSILLMGDAMQDPQRQMLASGRDLAATILRVPHHGGPGALDADFLARVQPDMAVISVGAGNRFGHPSADTLRRLEGIKVYRTDLDGMIEVGIERGGYWVKTARLRE